MGGRRSEEEGKSQERRESEDRKRERERALREESRFKIAVFCSRRRSTFPDKCEGTASPPKTAAPAFPPVTRGNGGQGSAEKWGNRI